MHVSTWKRRLVVSVAAAALGLAGVARAGEQPRRAGEQAADEVEELQSPEPTPQEEATGGSGQQEDTSLTEDALGQTEADEAVEDFVGEKEEEPELSVTANVGLNTFTGSLSDQLKVGTDYGVRAGTYLWDAVGFEVGYSGSRNALERELRPTEDAALYRNGVDALVKAGPTLRSGLRPFGGVGVGVAWFTPNAGAEDVYINDMVTELPLAAGLEYNLGLLSAGVRANWRFLFGEEFAQPLSGSDSEGTLLSATVNLGGRF
jgi:opacity protein-like surface antigen